MQKREKIFLVLCSVFITSLVLANVVGITKFVHFWGLSIPVGMLAYPVTFLCTDLISELYGHRHANFLVWVGLMMNVFLFAILSMGFYLPPDPTWLAGLQDEPYKAEIFGTIYDLMARATLASMIAYLIAQFCDVYFYHFWKRFTKDKHLWLRNNASTMTSQLIDTTAVMFITFWGKLSLSQILQFILFGYIFKIVAAALDTPFMYLGVHLLKPRVENE